MSADASGCCAAERMTQATVWSPSASTKVHTCARSNYVDILTLIVLPGRRYFTMQKYSMMALNWRGRHATRRKKKRRKARESLRAIMRPTRRPHDFSTVVSSSPDLSATTCKSRLAKQWCQDHAHSPHHDECYQYGRPCQPGCCYQNCEEKCLIGVDMDHPFERESLGYLRRAQRRVAECMKFRPGITAGLRISS
jgi:hypothetical protein